MGVVFGRPGTHSFDALMHQLIVFPKLLAQSIKNCWGRAFHLGNSMKVLHNTWHAILKNHLLAKSWIDVRKYAFQPRKSIQDHSSRGLRLV